MTTATTRESTETSDDAPTSPDGYIEVTFAGDGCTVSGPDQLPVGTGEFVVTNLTDEFLQLYVGPLDSGYDFQDLIDLQQQPGEMLPQPTWLHHAVELIAAPTGKTLEPNQSEWAFLLDQPEKNWVILLAAGQEDSLWFCSGLDVTA